VLDTASDRVVAYDLDGTYMTSWGGVAGAAISALAGRVFVADRERNQVRVFDGAGAESFAFGEHGTENGQFSLFTTSPYVDLSVGPYGPSAFSLVVQPLQTDRWPTNVWAVADYTDGWGTPGQIVFPMPEVEVVAPTPTPPEPTPTREPTRTATPTVPSGRSTIYLPMTLRGHSFDTPSDRNVDTRMFVPRERTRR